MSCTLSLVASVYLFSTPAATSGVALWPPGSELVEAAAPSVSPVGLAARVSVDRMPIDGMGSPEEAGAADSTCGRQAALNAALCVAATEGDVSATLALLLAGADVNARVEGGPPPLRLLLAARACRRPALSGGWTVLHLAASAGLTEELHGLLASGADAESKADDGATPLHAAAVRGHAEVAACLLKSVADATRHNRAGRTPLQEAILNGRTAVAELLRRHGAENSS